MAKRRQAKSRPAAQSSEAPPGDGLYWFDEAAADRAVRFFEKYLKHWKGEFAGRSLIPEPWERDIIRNVWGWKRRADGLRRYRKVYIEVPRKNGKSTLAGGLALLLLLADGEAGAEVYLAASDRSQAGIVFADASAMVEASPELRGRCELYKNTIVAPKTASKCVVLSKVASGKHGYNAHGLVIDELHAQPNRDLVDVLTTSMGARRQPLAIFVTTAGHDRRSICWEYHEYACKVRDGVIPDDAFYPVIYAADKDDDWTDPAVWAKANPSLGVAVKREYIAAECARAKEVPAYENTFRQLHLNQWTEQATRWLSLAAWDASALGPDGQPVPVIEEALRGRECWSGLDLSSTLDVTALVHVFPEPDGSWIVLPRFWIPLDQMRARVRRDRVPYDVWTRQGLITATDGNVIDYQFIRHQIVQDSKAFRIQELAYDPWNAQALVRELVDDGLPMVEFRQGFVSMSGPTKDLMTQTLARRIRHGANPVLRWMASNLVVRKDPAGNLKPDKEKSAEKIDGMVALTMGLDRAQKKQIGSGKQGPSVYETRGVLVLGA
ncbi:MAG: terminase large subunit [Gemmatimonadales bacterium]|nr:terminase large subunit [Gemmatimonadales bacterium]